MIEIGGTFTVPEEIRTSLAYSRLVDQYIGTEQTILNTEIIGGENFVIFRVGEEEYFCETKYIYTTPPIRWYISKSNKKKYYKVTGADKSTKDFIAFGDGYVANSVYFKSLLHETRDSEYKGITEVYNIKPFPITCSETHKESLEKIIVFCKENDIEELHVETHSGKRKESIEFFQGTSIGWVEPCTIVSDSRISDADIEKFFKLKEAPIKPQSEVHNEVLKHESVRIIKEQRELIGNLERDIQSYYNDIKARTLQKDKLEKTIIGFLSGEGREFVSLDKVKSIDMFGENNIVAITKPITLTVRGYSVVLGSFMITMKTDSCSISIRNLNGLVGEFDAPHVKNTHPCFGEHGKVINECIIKGRYDTALMWIIKYLEVATPSDTYGENWWKFAPKKDQVYCKKLNYMDYCYKCGILVEKNSMRGRDGNLLCDECVKIYDKERE